MNLPTIHLFLVATLSLCRRPSLLRWPFVAYAAAIILLTPISGNFMIAYTRYILVVFPAFIVFALWSLERPWMGRSLLFAFVFLAVCTCALFSRWYPVE